MIYIIVIYRNPSNICCNFACGRDDRDKLLNSCWSQLMSIIIKSIELTQSTLASGVRTINLNSWRRILSIVHIIYIYSSTISYGLEFWWWKPEKKHFRLLYITLHLVYTVEEDVRNRLWFQLWILNLNAERVYILLMMYSQMIYF